MTTEEALAIVETALITQRLNKIEKIVFQKIWEGLSYSEIARQEGYDTGYITNVSYRMWQLLSKAFGEKVTKKNLFTVLKRFQQREKGKGGPPATPPAASDRSWGEIIDIPVFYGRAKELFTLEQWIVQDRCRIVMILGMGGIGKTALAVKLAKQIQGEFEYLMWRSLRNAPPIQDLLADLIQFLTQRQEIDLPETVDGKVSRLIEYLRSLRCLLILDNAETILSGGNCRDCYREGYEDYGQLLGCVAETTHKSCLLLTSREQPRGWTQKSGDTLPIRLFQLTGLPTAAGREIVLAQGELQASDLEWEILIEQYSGNPLALKMVAPAIRDLFNRSIAKFLELVNQGVLVFGDLLDLLDRQFNRLSDLEKEVMYWIAIAREPVSFT